MLATHRGGSWLIEGMGGRNRRALLADSWARALLVPGAGPCGGAFSNVHGKRRECTRRNGANLRKFKGESYRKLCSAVLSYARL